LGFLLFRSVFIPTPTRSSQSTDFERVPRSQIENVAWIVLTIAKVDGRELFRDHHNLGCILTEIRTALLFRATAVSTGVMLECWIPLTYLWFVGR
jgi:hypothetical protein